MTDIILASRADWRCLDEALGERFSWCRWWHLQYRRARTDGSADESHHRVILTAQWLWPLGCFCCQEIGAGGKLRSHDSFWECRFSRSVQSTGLCDTCMWTLFSCIATLYNKEQGIAIQSLVAALPNRTEAPFWLAARCSRHTEL